MIASDPMPVLLNTAVGEVGVTCEGDARSLAVICIHGVPGSVRDFRYLAPLLSDHFYVVRVDAPGFGASPRGMVRSVAGWAETLHAVADALQLPRYVLLGHSFGGAATLHAAASAPARVAGLVLLASPGPRRHRAYFMPAWLCGVLARLLSDVPLLRWPLSEFGRFSYRQLALRPPADWRALQHQLQIISTLSFERLGVHAAAVSCPTLVCHCVDDPMVEVAIAEENAGLLRDCQKLILPSGGHQLQKHRAAEVAEAIIHARAWREAATRGGEL